MSERKILRVGIWSAFQNLDPGKAFDTGTQMLLKQVLESPYSFASSTADPEPLLFSEPLKESTTGGGYSYSAPVREGVRFSDGSELTAEVVAESLASSIAVHERGQVGHDGDRVVISCATPQPRLAHLLGPHEGRIYKRVDSGFVGTAPFQIADQDSSRVRLLRNPHSRYPAALDEIHFLAYEDLGMDRLVGDLENGTLDLCKGLSRDAITRLTSVKKFIVPGDSTAFLFFNTEKPGLSGLHNRQILAAAIDTLAIAKNSYSNPLAFRATSLVPPVLGRFHAAASGATQAAELQGLPKRLKLLVVWAARPYLPDPMSTARMLATQLGDLGLKVDAVQAPSRDDYLEQAARADYDLLLGGWIMESPDPADYLAALLSTQRIPHDVQSMVTSCNLARWTSPETESLMGSFRVDGNPATLSRIVDLVAEQVPAVPLLYGVATAAAAWRVRGFTMTAETVFDDRLWNVDLRA